MIRSPSAVVLFTLSPEAEGRRKSLGLGSPERAAAVFAALIEHIEGTCSRLPGVDFLLCTPNRTPSLGPVRRLAQRGKGFGESLRHAMEDAFHLGYDRVVVIGNDAPAISPRYLKRAFSKLESGSRKAGVLGPARDGGYTLLGLNTPCREAFDSIPWGTGRVSRLTAERLEQAGFHLTILPTLDDIDTHRALMHFLSRARRGALAALAAIVFRLLKTTARIPPARLSGLTGRSLVGWRGLRAPPGLETSRA